MSRASKRRSAQDARRQQAYARAKAQPLTGTPPQQPVTRDTPVADAPARRGVLRVLGLVRWQRVLLAILFTAGWALVAVPVVVRVPVNPFDTTGGAAWLSTVGISVFGLVMYGVGWWLLVGERGRTPTPHPVQVGVYLVSSVLALVLGVVWAWSVVGAVL